MAELPDPTGQLSADDCKAYEHMAAARSHADGRPRLGEVYVRMFNNPGVAVAVGNLGEHLRFEGTLPDRVRELVILRSASRQRVGYEWAHHVRPAQLSGLTDDVIDAVTRGELPGSLSDGERAALAAVDAVVGRQSIPETVQQQVVANYGTAGVVEVVALCGLYALMGLFTIAFDIPIEPDFPTPPSPPF